MKPWPTHKSASEQVSQLLNIFHLPKLQTHISLTALSKESVIFPYMAIFHARQLTTEDTLHLVPVHSIIGQIGS